MPTYAELRVQIEKLHVQAEEARQKEVAAVVSQIHDLVKQYGLVPSDLGLTVGRKRGAKSSATAKYRNPETGATWSGRGRAPNWLGKDRSKFEI